MPDGKSIKVIESDIWQDKHDVIWHVPAGLVCDGASIPRLLWWFIGSPFTGRYREAAIFHDAYYKEHCGRTRKQVDKMFYEKMRQDGVGWMKANSMYYGVRVFGWKPWA